MRYHGFLPRVPGIDVGGEDYEQTPNPVWKKAVSRPSSLSSSNFYGGSLVSSAVAGLSTGNQVGGCVP